MSVRTRVKKVDTSAVIRRLRAMRRRGRDFRSVFRWAHRELERAHAQNFDARGIMSGGSWDALDKEDADGSPGGYASWKLSNYGARGILVRSGNLKSSLTDFNSRGAVRDIGRKNATFGTTIYYAKFHQTGTSDMAQRKVVFVPKTFALGLAQASAERVVYGGAVGNTYTFLKNGLFT